MTAPRIPGYELGSPRLERFPVTREEFELLKKSIMIDDDDVKYLKMAGEVLKGQVEDVLDLWYGWVGSNPHLLHYFTDRETGKPIPEYLQAVRRRFGQWILDLCERGFDGAWLDYQLEIGRRHHKSKKNVTDRVNSVPHIPLRYMIAFIYPISATIKPFLAKKGHSSDEVERMFNAWFKAVVLSVALWSYPYSRDGEW
ncbi:MAG: protoglobin domain-containing protein [Thaumarchaeota archaeon]|nr:protoglobin domain-containing protein [Candidatus Calditenuaceae archaeon]MCX8203128.1 protoglobin domain-containing protein [Nitrososphaeria archaeon]MDW8043497.1 protoglobin domain-containing protein [Nitrososphaerota archaeon]